MASFIYSICHLCFRPPTSSKDTIGLELEKAVKQNIA
jgi:hypothetical protein